MASGPHADWGSTRKEARALAEKIGGYIGAVLGPVPGKDFSIGGVDLDTCRDPKSGDVESWADEIIDRFDSYAEISPSEAGVKIFFKYRGKPPVIKGAKRGTGKHPPAIEPYFEKRYFAVTERECGKGVPMKDVRKGDLDWLANEAIPRFKGHGASPPMPATDQRKYFIGSLSDRLEKAIEAIDPFKIDASNNYDPWIEGLMAIHFETGGDGIELAHKWSRRWEDHYDPDEVDAKWKSLGRNKGPMRTGAFFMQHATKQGVAVHVWFDDLDKTEPLDEKRGFYLEPYISRGPKTISPRKWLYSTYLAGVVGTTAAPGGVGKTALEVVEALACATGRNLLNEKRPPIRPLRVAIVNLEEDFEEIERRIEAAMLHHGITQEDITGRLFVLGRNSAELCVAKIVKGELKIIEPLVDKIESYIRENQIDIFHIDPWVASHRIPESDNTLIEQVAATWRGIAHRTGCHIHIWTHTRKRGLNQEEQTVEDARGASALKDAARLARVINRMTAKEAKERGIEFPSLYIRVDDSGKANMSPPSARNASWRRLASVALDNGNDDYPDGDNVQVVEHWEFTEGGDGLSDVEVNKALDAIEAAGGGRENAQASDWVGRVIGAALGWDLEVEAARLRGVVKHWLTVGYLAREERSDKTTNHKPRSFVVVRRRPEPDFEDEDALI